MASVITRILHTDTGIERPIATRKRLMRVNLEEGVLSSPFLIALETSKKTGHKVRFFLKE